MTKSTGLFIIKGTRISINYLNLKNKLFLYRTWINFSLQLEYNSQDGHVSYTEFRFNLHSKIRPQVHVLNVVLKKCLNFFPFRRLVTLTRLMRTEIM